MGWYQDHGHLAQLATMIKALLDFWDFVFSRLATTVPYWWLQLRIARTQVTGCQQQVLRAILQSMAGSDYLKHIGWTGHEALSEFQNKVPVVTYADIEPFIKKVYAGQSSALFRAGLNPVAFGLTSGTTGLRKIIPLTAGSFTAIRRAFWFMGVHILYQNPGNQIRGILSLASSPVLEKSPGGLPCGEITGMIAKEQTFILKSHYVMPEAVSEITDVDLKYYVSLRIALNNPRLMIILTATPATLVALAEYLERHGEQLVEDIAAGTCWREEDIPEPIRAKLDLHIHFCSERRARELRQLLQQHGKLTPSLCWPRLQAISTWLSGSFHHYRGKLRDLYRPNHLRDTGLSASEGHFTLPIANDSYRCLLNVWSYYFEFADPENPGRILSCAEVQSGAIYSLVVSTPGGLLRYDMQDLVQVVGFRNGIPLIEFQSKSRDFLDLTGEKLSAANASTVVAALASEQVRFLVSPNAQRSGFVFYFSQDLSAQAEKLDQELAKINACYAEHRAVGKLQPVQVKIIAADRLAVIDQNTQAQRQGSTEQFKPMLFLDQEL